MPSTARPATDEEVKAVLLLGFAQLSTWEQLPAEGNPFRICLVGKPALEAPLKAAAKGEMTHGRPIEVRRTAASQEALERCQLIFVSAKAAASFTGKTAADVARTALIVGERPDFTVADGAVNFFVENGRVGFEVNRSHAEHAGVRLSSRILRRARFVGGDRSEP